jgi:hypothetical protein
MAKKENVVIPQMELKNLSFRIRGTAPLIVHNFSAKSIKQMEDKQQKKGIEKALRNPDEEFKSGFYFFPDSNETRSGFPAVGFKAAMIRAGQQLGFPMTQLRTFFRINGTDGTDLIEIEGDAEMRNDMIRVATGGADIRYRPEYKKWEATLDITYNTASISAAQLAQIIELAGFGCGIGEWRPGKSSTGNYGTFELKKGE